MNLQSQTVRLGASAMRMHLGSTLVYEPPSAGGTLWTPSQIATDAWHSTREAAGYSLSGSSIAELYDKSGKNRTLGNGGVAASRATLVDVGGYPYASFDGVDDFYQSAATVSYTSGSPVEFFAVVRPQLPGVSSLENFWGMGGPSTNRAIGLRRTATDISIYSSSGGTSNGAIHVLGAYTAQALTIVHGSYEAATLRGGSLNGGTYAQATTTSFSPALDKISLGRNGGSLANRYFSGLFGEGIIVLGLLDAPTRDKLNGYLAWNWGLQGNLPAGHPYKNAAPTV